MSCDYDDTDGCEGTAVTSRHAEGGFTVVLCAACARWWDNREPSDAERANRAGVEGGIPYRDHGDAA